MGLLANTAAKGRGGDTLLGHLTPGDVVIPAERMSPQVQGLLGQILGPQLGRFTAGTAGNSINPKTGLPEFEGTGGEGTGEGPGSEGGTGGTGPGGGGTGGPGNGASAGDGGTSSGGTTSSSALDGMHGFTGMDPNATASHQSETVVDAKSTPPVSNTVSQTGLPGLLNDIQVGFQSHIGTPLAADPVGFLGKMAINAAMPSLANLASIGFTGQTIGDHVANLMGHEPGHVSGLGDQGTGVSAGAQGATGSSGGGQGNGGGNGIGGGNGLPPMPAGVGQAPSALAAAAAPSLAPPQQQFPFFGQQAFNPQSYLDQWNQRQRGIGINPMTGRGLLG